MKQAGGGAGDLERAAQLLSEKVQQEGGKGTPTIHEYYTKRTDMRTDERGEIISDEVNSKEPAAWNETTKTAMAVQAVAEELGESADTVGSKLQELLTLVPGLSSRMQSMKKAHLAKLAMSTGDVANKLVLLSTYFPSANIGKLCAARPDVLVMSEDDIREAADTLYELLGNLDVSYMVECEPIFLNKDAVEDAVKQAQRLFPERGMCRVFFPVFPNSSFDLCVSFISSTLWMLFKCSAQVPVCVGSFYGTGLRFLERDPKQILSLQGKDQLIEYDNVGNRC